MLKGICHNRGWCSVVRGIFKNFLLLCLGAWPSVLVLNRFLRSSFKIPSRSRFKILWGNKIITAEKIVKLKFVYKTLKIAKCTELKIVNEQILLELWIKECEVVICDLEMRYSKVLTICKFYLSLTWGVL